MPVSNFENPGTQARRYSSIAAHQRKVRYLRRIITPTQAFNAAQIAQYNPRLDSGVTAALTMAGVTPGDPVMDMISERAMYAEPSPTRMQDAGVFGEWVANPFKGIIRGTFMGLEGLIQEAESLLVRTPVGMAQGQSFSDAFGKSGRSDAYYALGAALGGQRVHAGSGFFSSDQTDDDKYIQDRLSTGQSLAEVTGGAEYQRQYGVDPSQVGTAQREQMQLTHGPSGKQTPVSLGRLAAIQVTEPGTRGFHAISGLVDTAKQIVLDPADLALGGVGKIRKLRLAPKMFDPSDATILTKAARGILLPGNRNTFFQRTWDEYLDSDSGRNVVNWMTNETGTKGLRNIYDVLGKSQKGKIDPNLVAAIRDADNAHEVRQLLKTAGENQTLRNVVGDPTGWINEFGLATRQGLNDTWLGRMASVTNSKMLNVSDRASAIADFDNYTLNLGLDATKRDELLERAITMDLDTPNYAGMLGENDKYSQYFQLVKDATDSWVHDVLKLEREAPMAQALAKVFKDEKAFRSFWIDNMGDDVMFGGARMKQLENGKWVTSPSPVTFSQFLEHGIPLMDSKVIRGAMQKSSIGRMFDNAGASKTSEKWLRKQFGDDDWEKLGGKAITNSLDFIMNKAWKPSVLLRVAWPVRVIGEEQFRLGGKLMAGMFNHPMQHMSLQFAHGHKKLAKFARMGNDVFMNDIMDDAAFEATMSAKRANIAEALTGKTAGRDGTGFRYTAKAVDEMTDDEFLEAMVFELNQLVRDDIAREVAGAIHLKYTETGEFSGSALDELKDRFFGGDLDHLRTRMISDSSQWKQLNRKSFADGYIDTIYGKLHHMGGGNGKLFNEIDGLTYDFSGNVFDAAGKTAVRGQEDAGRQFTKIDYGPDNYDPSDAITEAYRKAGIDSSETNRVLNATGGIYDEAINAGKGDTVARAEVENFAEAEMNRLLGSQGTGPGYGGMTPEYVPSVEAESGVGALGRQDFMGMNQTMSARRLSDEVIQGRLNEGMDDALRGLDYDEAQVSNLNQLTAASYDDLQNTESLVIEIADFDDAEELLTTRTYLHVRNGEPTAVVVANVSGGKVIGVDFAGGHKTDDLKKIHAALNQNEIVGLEEMFGFTSGEQPFWVWLKEQGIPVNSNEDIWKALDENPDLMKRFYGGEKTDPTDGSFGWEGGKSPRAAGHGGTTTTRSGTVMNYANTQEAVGESAGWSQHRPYFEMEQAGDPRIFELVANGGLADESFMWGGRATTNKAVRSQFKDRKAWFGNDIETWRGNSPTYLRQVETTNSARDISRWDQGMGVMMQTLMSKPSDYLSRSPAFRQFYWARATEMAHALGQEDRVKFLAAAEKANLLQADDAALKLGSPLRTLRRYTGRENTVDEAIRRVNNLAGKAATTEPGAISTLEQLDAIAKAYALEETKGLLYDMSKSHNWAEATRFMLPFGEAWFEVMSTWGKLVKENPRNLRRMQQVVQGAQKSDPFRDVGPDGEQGRGFFYKDPTTGEEVFAYPDPSLIPSWMPFFGKANQLPENVKYTSRVSGLSMMANVMPGFGPILQIPMSQLSFFQDVDNRWMRDIAMPFGKSTVEGADTSTWLDPLLPTWFNKWFQSYSAGDGANTRLQANTTIDVYKTLLMQGWSDDSPEQMDKTLKEASRIAGDMTRIRSLAAFAAPAGVQASFEVAYVPEDREGDIWSYTNLATAYRQLLDEKNGDEVQAAASFNRIFGIDPMLFAVSKTQKVLPRAVTLEARKWEQDNADLYEQHMFPLTAYYANPDPTDGTFDYETYLLQLKDESKTPLSPTQWALKRNQFLGRVAYNNFQRQAERQFDSGDERQRFWLQNMHSGLRELFPGYGQNIVSMPEKPSLGDERTGQIGELYRWIEDERLSQSEVGRDLRRYLRMRDSTIRASRVQFGYTTSTGWRTGVRMTVHRRRLDMLGRSIASKNPQFIPLWNQILSRELQAPETSGQPANLMGVSFNG